MYIPTEQYKEKKSKDDEQTRQIEKQASLERQKVYEDVFLQEMQHYIQYGATESNAKHTFGCKTIQMLIK